MAGTRWILDTAYGAWLDVPLPRTELIAARKSERIRQWEADPTAPRVLRFTSARQTEAWLTGLDQLPS